MDNKWILTNFICISYYKINDLKVTWYYKSYN